MRRAKVTLAAEAVAMERWRWLPGMRYWSEHRRGWDRIPDRPNDASFAKWLRSTSLPDLDDAATLGCIEHGLLPEFYGENCSLWHSATGWHYGRDGMSFGSGSTKGEALVEALRGARPWEGDFVVPTVKGAQ